MAAGGFFMPALSHENTRGRLYVCEQSARADARRCGGAIFREVQEYKKRMRAVADDRGAWR